MAHHMISVIRLPHIVHSRVWHQENKKYVHMYNICLQKLYPCMSWDSFQNWINIFIYCHILVAFSFPLYCASLEMLHRQPSDFVLVILELLKNILGIIEWNILSFWGNASHREMSRGWCVASEMFWGFGWAMYRTVVETGVLSIYQPIDVPSLTSWPNPCV